MPAKNQVHIIIISQNFISMKINGLQVPEQLPPMTMWVPVLPPRQNQETEFDPTYTLQT